MIRIAEDEIELLMKMYKEYQAQNQKEEPFKAVFTPKPIMRDLVKGVDHFKNLVRIDDALQ